MASLQCLDAKDDPLPPSCPPLGPTSQKADLPRLSDEELAEAAQSGGSRGFGALIPFFGPPKPLLIGSLLLRLRSREVLPEDVASEEVTSIIGTLKDAVSSSEHPLGVAAPMYGVPKRVIALGETDEMLGRLSDRSKVTEEHAVFGPFVMLNPVVTRRASSQFAYFWERCSSVPGYQGVVGRDVEVDVSGLDEKGREVKLTVRGWRARQLQHTVDMLDGVLYVDRMERRSFCRSAKLWDVPDELPEDVPFGTRPRAKASAGAGASAARRPSAAGPAKRRAAPPLARARPAGAPAAAPAAAPPARPSAPAAPPADAPPDAGYEYMPGLSSRHVRSVTHSRTNLLVILQAFPGNIPWGVIIVYLHDFLVQDLGLSRHKALGAITTLAAAAFAGILTGGFVGERLYGASSKYLAIFGGICNMARAVPFFLIFGWADFFGPLASSSEGAFFLVLMAGGF
ncbi:unnamed protein product, partial [Prorocentrum cordatum]